jgi:putative PIG3 family NAD(P)H quinone oxidoreductase
MRRLEVVERGAGYDARLVEEPDPVPKAGEVLLRVAGSGVNRADLAQIAGKYPPPPGESQILGMEASGTVEGAGEKMCALLAGGGHAQLVVVPEGQLFPLPRGLELVSGAAIPEVFLTAFVNLVVEAGLREGEGLLVHAGASGVGLAAIQMGKLLGARVAATTRTAEKVPALVHAGADLAIATSREPFDRTIEESWGKASVSVVLDPIGAQTVAGDLKVLASGGRVVLIAALSGAQAELDLGLLMGKRARLIGSMLRGRSREEKAALVARFRREILPAFEDGRLTVTIDSVFPASQAASAFTRMRENRNIGKILIDWTGED